MFFLKEFVFELVISLNWLIIYTNLNIIMVFYIKSIVLSVHRSSLLMCMCSCDDDEQS